MRAPNKEQKRSAHRQRMQERRARQLARTVGIAVFKKGRWKELPLCLKPILANLSRRHHDRGLTPYGHAICKADRNAK